MATVRKLPRTAFQKGCPPGPGRPPGQRNRLTEVMVQLLSDSATEHGAETTELVRQTKPHILLQALVSLLPRQVVMEKLSPLSDSDDEVHELEQMLAGLRAHTVNELSKINGTAIAQSSDQKK